MSSTSQERSCQPHHCEKCGSIDLQEREKPPHIGLYCRQCGAWVTWVRRSKLRVVNERRPILLEDVADEDPQPPQQLPLPTPERNCSHCPELDRLSHELAGVNRALHVIVKALINGGAVRE